jgi:hypothetical protein
LWALTAANFSAAALGANVGCWLLGLVLLTRPAAVAFFGEE